MKKLFVILLAVVMLACCSCSKPVAKPLNEVYADIKAQVGFDNITELDSIRLMERYYGITEEMAEEFVGCISASGVNQEEIVLVKAPDEVKANAVKACLENRYQAKLNQTKNYEPEQAAMIENCSVEQDGLYVSMILSENADAITKIYRSGIGLK